VITKILVSGAVVLGAALGLAAPAGADPSVFNDLSCGCPQTVSNRGPSVTDQIERGIQSGLAGINAVETEGSPITVAVNGRPQ
jgi:hypothetical protein